MSNGKRERRVLDWSQVDVFAEAPIEGNMLAIFHDARGLTDEEMQALARETNLSETTFILPRDEAEEREHGVRVRIFTTEEELPFAGHPTLGTASWLWLNHSAYRHGNTISLHLNAGTVSVRFDHGQGGIGVPGEMTQLDPVFGPVVDRTDLETALGFGIQDLHAHLQPQMVSTGLPMLVVPLRSVEAASRMRVNNGALAQVLHRCGARFAYCIAPLPDGGDAHWHARLPLYNGEDPATGSAAGCAMSYLVRHGIVSSDRRIAIRQGIEMRRPSRILASASLEGETVRNVRVGGRTIPVATGRFFLP